MTFIFQVEEVYNFCQDDLLTEDILILDTHAEVFVWVGHSVDSKEKQDAFEFGQVLDIFYFQLLKLSSICASLNIEAFGRNMLRWLLPWKGCLQMFHYTE